MRLALYHHLPPGGALRSVTEIVRHLPSTVTCDVFTLDTSDIWPFRIQGQADGVPGSVHRHPVRRPRWAKPLPRNAAVLAGIRPAEREVAELINGGRYEAVLVHPCWFTQAPQIMAHLVPPVVYYMHEPRRASFEAGARVAHPPNISVTPRRVAGWVVERRLKQQDIKAAWLPDRILCNSYYSAESIKRSYGLEATVSYLGTDVNLFELGTRPRDEAVLAVGGFEPFKRHDVVVEALAGMPAIQRPIFRIAYERVDAQYRALVRDRAKALGVTLEEYHGIDDFTLAALYRNSLATILVADLEPFGLTMLESLASGTPLVAVAEGGYREVVQDGFNGVIVPRTPAGLAAGIREVAQPGRVMGAAELRASLLPFWTWASAAERQMSFIREVLVKPKAP